MACTMKALIPFLLTCSVATAVSVRKTDTGRSENLDEFKYRLPKNVAPIHYDLKFVPDITKTFTFEGKANIKFKVHEPTSNVVLHSRNLTLTKAVMNLKSEDGNLIFPQRYTEHPETDTLKIYLRHPLKVGIYTLNLQFSGNLQDSWIGFFRDHYKNSKGEKIWLATTQFEPIYARTAFPCWDEPALKATFNISIKHYPNYTALSNMPAREKTGTDKTDGKMWTHFERTPIMSTYVVAFIIADFVHISNVDGTINAWSRKDRVGYLKFAHEIAQKATRELELYTNSTVRVPKMDHVVIPEHSAMAMENWGLILYPESSFVYDKEKTSSKQKFEIIETVVHELAHQWFGNIVGPSWWTHIWLQEGFATYFEHYIMDKIFKDWRIMEYFVGFVVQRTISTDSEWHVGAVDGKVTTSEQIEDIFSDAVYNKAPSILHMLSNIISPEVFRSGIIRYLNKHEYSSTNPDDIWNAMQSALDASKVSRDGFKIKEVMDPWIKQQRYPLVYVNRDYTNGTMTLTQKDFGLIDVHEHDETEQYENEDKQFEWWIPINYATKTNLDFANTRFTHWLKPAENLTISGLHPDDWIIVNKQQSGYYKVTYDNENWRKIGAYLRSKNYTNIHVLNRAQIVNDITELITYDLIEPTIFLEVITYLSQETDYIPWYPVFNFLKIITRVLGSPSGGPIKNFVLKMMENLIKDVGFEERADDDPLTILKRAETLHWACELGHSECRRMATIKLMEYLGNSSTTKISPNLKMWVYENGMRSVNESIWNRALENCVKNPLKEVFRSLSVTENPVLFQKYLNTAISNDTSISKENKDLMLQLALDSSKLTIPIVNTLLNFAAKYCNKMNTCSKFSTFNLHELYHKVQTKEQLEELKRIFGKVSRTLHSEYWKKKIKAINYAENIAKKWEELARCRSINVCNKIMLTLNLLIFNKVPRQTRTYTFINTKMIEAIRLMNNIALKRRTLRNSDELTVKRKQERFLLLLRVTCSYIDLPHQNMSVFNFNRIFNRILEIFENVLKLSFVCDFMYITIFKINLVSLIKIIYMNIYVEIFVSNSWFYSFIFHTLFIFSFNLLYNMLLIKFKPMVCSPWKLWKSRFPCIFQNINNKYVLIEISKLFIFAIFSICS
ncbi:aminopeptidase N-like [Xylocopa sonorina]|uniref:aminopeptidase N-like n=1 Tax=Xylocopa sonorina TaxID=1818115 RepID=UPI00403B1099